MSEFNLKEKQKKKLKRFWIVSIVLFLAILIMPTVIWGVGTIVSTDYFREMDYDLGEKREKAPMPTSFSSSYGTKMEAYYNDRLPFRSVIITANRRLTSAIEKPYNDVISPCLVRTFYSDYGAPAQEEVLPVTQEKTESDYAMLEVESVELQTTEEETTEVEATETDTTEADTTETVETEATEVEATEDETETVEVIEEVPVVDPNYMPPRIFNDHVIEGRDGWLFFSKENSLEDYLGINILSNDQMNEYLNGMLRLQSICDAQGKQLYFIIPPNKEIAYSEKMPSFTVENEYRRGARLVDYIHANSSIKLVYPLEELKRAKSEWQPYFRTDTHWTELGAFVGVQSLYALMGMPTTDIHQLSVVQEEYLGGDLILLGNLDQESYRGDIRYKIQYKPEIGVESVDGSLGLDWIYKAKSNSPNQCNMVLIGDSFRLFMSSFIEKDYSSYTHIHWKYLEDPSAKEAIRNANVIVIESVERFNWTLPNTLSSVSNTLES